MNGKTVKAAGACLLAFLVCLGPRPLCGYEPAAKGEPATKGTPVGPSEVGAVKVKKFTALGNQSSIRTPEFRSSYQSPNAGKPPKEWVQVVTTYDTTPPWIDELSFQYYVLTEMGAPDGKGKVFTLFKCAVRYADIEKGKGHLSAVYLRPAGVKRFGTVIAAGVEITYNGQIVQTDQELAPASGLPTESWWTKLKDNVVVKDGYLLPKWETPFAIVNVDDFEVEQH